MKENGGGFMNIFLIGRRLLVAALVACVICSMPAFSADNGCDNPDNDMISAELALCSTHAYNIGLDQNPSGADRELMREVIAMKTTLITQQMYKQYQQMESMLRRLKTQLEKAVLNTKLQAAAGKAKSDDDDDDDEFESNNRSIHIANARDCNAESTAKEVLTCLEKNAALIYDRSANGTKLSSNLRKQLAGDYGLAVLSVRSKSSNWKDPLNQGESAIDCTKEKELSKKAVFQKCLDNLRVIIRTANGSGGSSK